MTVITLNCRYVKIPTGLEDSNCWPGSLWTYGLDAVAGGDYLSVLLLPPTKVSSLLWLTLGAKRDYTVLKPQTIATISITF